MRERELDVVDVTQEASTGDVPSDAQIDELLQQAYLRCAANVGGEIANYIPALAQADPDALRRADKPMDLITEDGKIGVEYVSAGDAAAWDWKEGGGTVAVYNVKDAAEEHRGILAEDDREEQRAVSKGVLYDPCACSDLLDDEETFLELAAMSGEEQEEYFRKADEEALRAQVRDFIDWLETQGVLAS